jgi:hypothetical protein
LCPFTYCDYRETSRPETREEFAGPTVQTEIVSYSSCGETTEAELEFGEDGVFNGTARTLKI